MIKFLKLFFRLFLWELQDIVVRSGWFRLITNCKRYKTFGKVLYTTCKRYKTFGKVSARTSLRRNGRTDGQTDMARDLYTTCKRSKTFGKVSAR